MDYVKKYGELIKDKAGVKPERARSMIRLGLRAENARTKLLLWPPELPACLMRTPMCRRVRRY